MSSLKYRENFLQTFVLLRDPSEILDLMGFHAKTASISHGKFHKTKTEFEESAEMFGKPYNIYCFVKYYLIFPKHVTSFGVKN